MKAQKEGRQSADQAIQQRVTISFQLSLDALTGIP